METKELIQQFRDIHAWKIGHEYQPAVDIAMHLHSSFLNLIEAWSSYLIETEHLEEPRLPKTLIHMQQTYELAVIKMHMLEGKQND